MIAGVLALSACAPIGPVPPYSITLPAGPTSPGASTATGYTLVGSYPQGHYTVRLAPGSPAALRGQVAYVVGRLSAAGASVAVGADRAAGAPIKGEITVGAVGQASVNAACQSLDGSNYAGCTRRWTTGATIFAGEILVRQSDVARPVMRAILLHEMGHAFGLDHYARAYQGAIQAMSPTVSEAIGDYRAGDRAGIAAAVSKGRTAANVGVAQVESHGAACRLVELAAETDGLVARR